MITTEWCFIILTDRVGESSESEKLTEIIRSVIKTADNFKKDKIALVFCLRATNGFIKQVYDSHTEDDNSISLLVYESAYTTAQTCSYDISSAEGIELLFSNHVSQKITSAHYGLFTWGHGGAYSFFEELGLTGEQRQQLVYEQLKINNSSDTFNNYFYSKKYEAAHPDKYLNMEELYKGVLKGMKQKKLDIVIMSHCYMAYYETGRMMSKCAAYWVAATGKISFDSLNIHKNLMQINNSDSVISPRQFAIAIINDSKDGNFFCYNLKSYPLLTQSLYSFAGYLIWEMKKNRTESVIKLRKECTELDETSNYHLLNITAIGASSDTIYKDGVIHKACNKVLQALKSITVDSSNSKTGLSIYFPLSAKEREDNRDDLLDVRLKRGYRKNIWMYFIFLYLLTSKEIAE